jgi:hypothetical protein
MKAYVVRDRDGNVVRGWLVARGGPPPLSARDRAWLATSKRRMEEVSMETAFRSAAKPCNKNRAATAASRKSNHN